MCLALSTVRGAAADSKSHCAASQFSRDAPLHHRQAAALRALLASSFALPSRDSLRAALCGEGFDLQLLQHDELLSSAELLRVLGSLLDRAALAHAVQAAVNAAGLVAPDDGSFKFSAETLTGRTFALTARPGDTVRSVKQRIFSLEPSFPVGAQRLVHVEFGEEAMADDAPLSAYGVTRDSQLSLFTSGGVGEVKYVGSVRAAGTSAFKWPEGIALDAVRNRLIVADYGNSRIVALNRSDWSTAWQFGETGEPGSGSNRVNFATACVLSADSRFVYCADGFNHRIVMLDASSGAFVKSFGTMGSKIDQLHFRSPMGIALDAGNRIWIADVDNHRVLCYTVDASTGDISGLVLQIGHAGMSGAGNELLNLPRSVAIADNRVFVCDKLNSRVQVFNASTGAHVHTIGGSESSADGEFAFPHSVSAADGKIYVADQTNRRVSVFSSTTYAFLGILGGARASKHPASVFAVIGAVLVDPLTNGAYVTDDRFGGNDGRLTVWSLKK
jgi:DNA-binding beta-propeller fold protein YncE